MADLDRRDSVLLAIAMGSEMSGMAVAALRFGVTRESFIELATRQFDFVAAEADRLTKDSAPETSNG